jgi:hypothetical protein
MTGTEVPVQRTRWTNASLLAAYALALRAHGIEPTREALACLWAQSSLECGRDGQSCWNWNVSNIMHFAPRQGRYHILGGAPECAPPDRIPAGATRLDPSKTSVKCAPGHVPYIPAGGSRFRAYATLAEGCVDKVATLAARWPQALAALAEATGGSVDNVAARFVTGLVTPRYFTASVPSYLSILQSLARECIRTVREEDWPPQRDTIPAPAGMEDTQPQTPTSKSSQRLQAVREPIATHADRAATPLRAGEGEHTPAHLRDDDLEGIP